MIRKASSGMYIYERKAKKEKLCEAIDKSFSEKKYPIVHDDSLTAWGNLAAEQYGSTIGDILKMNEGETVVVILFDRNVGDYMDGTKVGHTYNPRKKGLMKGTYTHYKELSGKFVFDTGDIHDSFTWEINTPPLNIKHSKDDNSFWSPLPNNINIKNLDKK